MIVLYSGWSPIPSDSSPKSLKTRDLLQKSRDVCETELAGNHSSSMLFKSNQ